MWYSILLYFALYVILYYSIGKNSSSFSSLENLDQINSRRRIEIILCLTLWCAVSVRIFSGLKIYTALMHEFSSH